MLGFRCAGFWNGEAWVQGDFFVVVCFGYVNMFLNLCVLFYLKNFNFLFYVE